MQPRQPRRPRRSIKRRLSFLGKPSPSGSSASNRRRPSSGVPFLQRAESLREVSSPATPLDLFPSLVSANRSSVRRRRGTLRDSAERGDGGRWQAGRRGSLDSVHHVRTALENAGMGFEAEKIANLIELSKKASRTGIQEEFFNSCTSFDHPEARMHRASLFIDDARAGRPLKLSRLGKWEVWVYQVEKSSWFLSLLVIAAFAHFFCAVYSPYLRPERHLTLSTSSTTLPVAYPQSIVFLELSCLTLYTIQLGLCLFHSYGTVFFRIVDKNLVPNLLNLANAFFLFLFWLDFLLCVVARWDLPRFSMLFWVFRLVRDVDAGRAPTATDS